MSSLGLVVYVLIILLPYVSIYIVLCLLCLLHLYLVNQSEIVRGHPPVVFYRDFKLDTLNFADNNIMQYECTFCNGTY